MDSLTLKNPLFKAYVFYSCVLVFKMMIMSVLTARVRLTKKVFANKEDLGLGKNSKLKLDDPDVERIRRAHLNDLENIPLFLVAALAYILTKPNPWLALNLMRAFVFARVAHTLVYAVVVVPQPARAFSWAVAYVITGYMAFTALIAAW